MEDQDVHRRLGLNEKQSALLSTAQHYSALLSTTQHYSAPLSTRSHILGALKLNSGISVSAIDKSNPPAGGK